MLTHWRLIYTATVIFGFTAGICAQPPPARLTVSSPTLVAGQPVPRQHTADGENISPALQWSSAPATTRSFALVCDDPDVPIPGGFVHWVVYNIPADGHRPAREPADRSRRADAAAIAGTVQGLSGFKRPIYRGPAPPPGKPHHYHFTVYALDVGRAGPRTHQGAAGGGDAGAHRRARRAGRPLRAQATCEVGLPPWPMQPSRDAIY